eukprot:TRINITY_DN1939_c0_g1_i2.p1 TRINITY_DN1939_c0_g1~~TRINITY_DN1939_c0_g1_i2.p1  ORF type:complete len:269 (+),score=69.32 TRINITY_DN1939_c0_g1_i2:129-935(+)
MSTATATPGQVINVTTIAVFDALVQQQQKLLVVDFTASWCGPCKTIEPVFNELATLNKHVIFARVDVDKGQEVALSKGVSSTPTFHFYKGGQRLQAFSGANAQRLKDLVAQLGGSADDVQSGALPFTLPPNQGVLNSFIQKGQSQCLNENTEHTLAHALDKDAAKYLESDCDEQLLISIAFNQSVKIHSLYILSPDTDRAPRNVKLFVARPSLDFGAVEDENAIQALDLDVASVSAEEGDGKGALVNLKYVRFQRVTHLTLFRTLPTT